MENVTSSNGIYTVHFPNELVLMQSRNINDTMISLLEKEDLKAIFLDCGKARMMDSMAMGGLVKLAKVASDRSVTLCAYELHGTMLNLFKMAHLDKVYHVCKDAQDAENVFNGGTSVLEDE